jgi:general secretion pathway protein A
MYSRFFGFKERPFKLVPNPAYLFLSKSHEEVLAHLTYAVNHGDGFVEITGEVGTGKTTICRVFVEKLDSSTEAAYIFNPKLDAVQLLKAVNSEFGIDAGSNSCQELIDTLNAFLIFQKADNRRVILIIDEAQNLNAEVLEQLRLLSNLETTQNKLLQIILVGQPELNEMLNSYELRQLGQRISLSCRLMPMTFAETRAYIQHRIRIASHKGDHLFSWAAMRAIHRYSGGIPRLINIACDRALLTAFGRNHARVTGRIAKAAVNELARRSAGKRSRRRTVPSWVAVAMAVLLIIGGVLLLYPGIANINGSWKSIQHQNPPAPLYAPPANPERTPYDDTDPAGRSSSTLQAPAVEAPSANPSPDANPGNNEGLKDRPQNLQEEIAPDERGPAQIPPERDGMVPQTRASMESQGKPDVATVETTSPAAVTAERTPEAESIVGSLHDFLSQMDGHASRRTAARSLLKLWDLESDVAPYLDQLKDTKAFFGRVAQQNGLQCYPLEDNFNLIKKLNLPAVMVFNLPGRPESGYLALREIAGDKVILAGDEGVLIVADPALLKTYYAKEAYVFWKNFDKLDGVIPLTSSSGAVLALKVLLKEIGFGDLQVNAHYDDRTRLAVREIQTRHGLAADGFVGPLTKMVLYNEKSTLPIPHLAQES